MIKFAFCKIKNRKCTKLLKPLILIASLMTFLYLVISTMNSNALVAKQLSDGRTDQMNNVNILADVVHAYKNYKYNDQFIKTILKELQLSPSLYVEDDGGDVLCEANKANYQNIIISLPGDKLIDFIWEYISIWSLSNTLKKLKQHSNIYLTDKTINKLETFFDIDCLKIPSISDVPRRCLDMQMVQVLKPTQILNLNDYVGNVPFILEKNSKRVFDIVESDLKPMRKELQIQNTITKTIDDFLQNVTNSVKLKKNKQDSYKYVCSYIQEGQQHYVPYIKSAIEFHHHSGISIIFIFLVPPKDHKFYSDEFGADKDETIKVLNHNTSEAFNIALLIQCHRTIILNEFTLATALLNTGVATLPKDDPLFILFKSKIFNWYTISNNGNVSE